MKKLAFLITVLAINYSCRNDYAGIPDVTVDLYINTLDPTYQHLSGLGAWSHAPGGSRGIIVFQYDLGKYFAYERHCTYLPENTCATVAVDQSNLYAVDTCCGSKFQLLDGVPIEGTATIPLKSYNTSFDGNIIHIWN